MTHLEAGKTIECPTLPGHEQEGSSSIRDFVGPVLAAGGLSLLTLGCRGLPWLGMAIYGLFALMALVGPAANRQGPVRMYTACQIAVLGTFVALRLQFDGHAVPVWQLFVLALVLLDIGPDLLGAARRRQVLALAGLVLVMTLPGPWNLRCSPEGVRYEAAPGWILLYTLWSGAAACSRAPRLAVLHLAVLAVPLLLAGLDSTLWGQTRAMTLAITSLTLVHFPRLEAALALSLDGRSSERLGLTLGGMALAVAACRLPLWLAGK